MKKRSPVEIRLFAILSTFLFLISACSLPSDAPSTGRGFADLWYVATTGSDSNSCLYSDDPCETIMGALNKAYARSASYRDTYTDVYSIHHTINIAAGIYRNPHLPEENLPIRDNITLQGASSSDTILDFDNHIYGIFIMGAFDVSIYDLTIRDVTKSEATPYPAGSGDCIFARRPPSSLTIHDTIIKGCGNNGISATDHAGIQQIELQNVIINDCGRDGLNQTKGNLSVDGSTFHANGRAGLYLYNVNMNISGSTFSRNYYYGIQLWGASGPVTGSEFLDNGDHPSIGFGGGTVSVATAGLHINRSDTGSNITVDSSHFAGNFDGIVSSGRDTNLIVTNSIIENQKRTGIEIYSGYAELTNVSITDNGSEGVTTPDDTGGIYMYSSTVKLREVTVNNNYGGIYLHVNAVLEAYATTISGNDSNFDGGITNNGTVDLVNSTVSGNKSEWLVDGHHADGIFNKGTMRIINSTISGNLGVGILAAPADMFRGNSTLDLYYVTIASNLGAGLITTGLDQSGIRARNTLFAMNGTVDCNLGAGNTLGDAVNLDSDGTCGALHSFPPVDIALAPLGDNGGPTQTHALGFASVAIDLARGACPDDDQRYYSRPSGEGCDVGAYEVGGVAPEAPVSTPTLCLTGPGPEYDTVSSLAAGIQVQIIGVGSVPGWLIIDSPRFPGVPCWVPEEDLDIDPDLDLSDLPEFEVPPIQPADDGVPDSGAPAAPGNLKAETICASQEYKVILTWKDNAGNETGYRVFRDGVLIANLGPNATKFIDTSPSSSMPQTYKVIAFNNAGQSAPATTKDDGCLI
jgi:hypothetical protein